MLIFSRASLSPNHWARSTSGNSRIRPDRGGHCIEKLLLATRSASRSPAIAQARTSLPDFWRISPRSIASPAGAGDPSSSSNSRRAAEAALVALIAEGRAQREPLGDDALWLAAERAQPS